MKKKKNENFVDVDDVDVRGGPTVGGLIGPPPLWGDFDVGDLPRWTVSVSDFAVWGVEPRCGGSDIADIAPPPLWLELEPPTYSNGYGVALEIILKADKRENVPKTKNKY